MTNRKYRNISVYTSEQITDSEQDSKGSRMAETLNIQEIEMELSRYLDYGEIEWRIKFIVNRVLELESTLQRISDEGYNTKSDGTQYGNGVVSGCRWAADIADKVKY